ncbi:MAG: hypothetical protein H7A53_07530 [Akkermansiaceae bacterium]|nr:hypothetical protein [Akkermansiaceae bacterium]MCP5550724.1 hypothetical protein [Akkermansiaceae bacterium]
MVRYGVYTGLVANAVAMFLVSGNARAQTLTPGAAAAATASGARKATAESVMPAAAVTSVATAGAAITPTGPAGLPGFAPDRPALPKVFAPTRPRTLYTRYPWKRGIVATVFWIGELPTENNPTPNTKSAWDVHWVSSYGGYDDPKPAGREGYRPKAFEPGQNPFYIALPYNDLRTGASGTKTSARHVVPWFDKEFQYSGKTIVRGHWIAIRRGSKVCYAQWEDVGPFETDDWQYVFGDARPKTSGNGGAGLDVSPAVRDYLDFSTKAICDWRFVDIEEVPEGPWREFGSNNHFARTGNKGNGSGEATAEREIERIVKLRELSDEYLSEMPMAR